MGGRAPGTGGQEEPRPSEQPGIDPVALLEAITRAQAAFIDDRDLHGAYDALLHDLLVLTGSELGFIGNVLAGPDGGEEMAFAAVAGVDTVAGGSPEWVAAWRAPQAVGGSGPPVFSGIETLFGRAIATRRPVLAGPAETARLRLPPGHPKIRSFLALPILSGQSIVALAGVANHPGVYDARDVEALAPLTRAVAQLVEAARGARQRSALEERLALVAEAAEVGTWDWDLAHGVLAADAGARAILGYAPPGKTLEDAALVRLVHPADVPAARVAIDAARRGGQAFGLELRLRSRGGEWRWVEARGRAVPGDSPAQPARMVGTLTDIGRRKSATEAVRRERDLFLSGPAVLFLWRNEPGWPVEQVSPNVEELLGHPARSFLTGELAYGDLIHPDDRERVGAEVLAATAGKTLFTHEPYRLRHRGGHDVWVLDHTAVIRNEAGEVTAFQGFLLDISSRLAAEEQLGLWASVFLHAHEGIVVTDGSGAVLDANEAYLRMTGYSKEELVGKRHLLGAPEQEPELVRDMWRGLLGSGSWRGDVTGQRKDGTRFVQSTALSAVRGPSGLPTNYIGLVHDVTATREAERRLQHLAFYDSLTGLPNRSLLADRLEHAIAQAAREERGLAVCYLDLDGFKEVNDRFGHEAGDRLLVEVAERLVSGVRGGDTVSRLGGDEFVLLLGGLSVAEECDATLRRILASIAVPFDVPPGGVTISGSIGVAFYPQDGAEPDTLLRQADQALYTAKEAGRNRYHFFDTARQQRARARRSTIERMTVGLMRKEFVLRFQPKVDMRKGRPVGLEALIRWRHPEKGIVSPPAFLHVLDESELSVPLGEWVVEDALSWMDAWAEGGHRFPVSVNISGRHLQSAGFVGQLEEALKKHPRVSPELLELEILESVALSDLNRVARVIEECRRLGVGFALDDFGTGFSSLTYLRRLPVQTLKIDQSFVRDMLDDPADTAIVEGVIGLGFSFQRDLVAEGVETVEQGLLLMRMGCDLAQGYAIALPLEAEEVPAWWRSWSPPPEWTAAAEHRYAVEDVGLFTIEIHQRFWLKQVVQAVTDPGHAPRPREDARGCTFGRWVEDAGSRRYRGHAAFARLVDAHHRIHAVAEALLRGGSRGAGQEAVEELLAEQDRLLEALHEIQAAVAFQGERAGEPPGTAGHRT